jgi:hypothetical protein
VHRVSTYTIKYNCVAKLIDETGVEHATVLVKANATVQDEGCLTFHGLALALDFPFGQFLGQLLGRIY